MRFFQYALFICSLLLFASCDSKKIVIAPNTNPEEAFLSEHILFGNPSNATTDTTYSANYR